MRVTIIDEKGFSQNGQRIVVSREIKQINIPDEILMKLKAAFDIFQEEQKRKKDGGADEHR